MSRDFHDIKVGLDEDLEEKLSWMSPGFQSFHILRQSVDARQRHNPHLVYSLRVFEAGETPPDPTVKIQAYPNVPKSLKPIIVGSGPAGLFAALRFVERGVPCTLLERGGPTHERMQSINRFWRYGQLDPENNVNFGEGGAGLYSDGKLITRIKSPHIPYVLDRLVRFGAPPEIRYLANPHVGSDRIRRLIPKLRAYLLANNCDVQFHAKVSHILMKNQKVEGVQLEDGRQLKSPHVILATGHSAEDIFQQLESQDVHMSGKSFALGLRIEHPQDLIDRIQYRDQAGHPKLGAANYRLSYHNKKQNYGVYSFCMCPGGYILNCATHTESVVTNGMSNYNRGSKFANSAIVISVDHATHFGSDLFGGLKFRRQLEASAFQAVVEAGGLKEIPAQKLFDFFERKQGSTLPSSSPSKVVPARLDQLFPKWALEGLTLGLKQFANAMPEFLSPLAQLHGVETRTSCPIRITRDPDSLESTSHVGLYPCGEGAGYAGGITSAACDGIRVAEALMHKELSHRPSPELSGSKSQST